MSEQRRMFPELQGDLAQLTAGDLQSPLAEIATGTSSFGPFEEWTRWYHYLLGQLIPRSHDASVYPLLELLVTGFMSQYPNGVHRPPYPEFAQDVLSTLGRCVMEPRCWDGNQIVVGAFLHRSNRNPAQTWQWYGASGDLSASLFLCLKYLPASSVSAWFRSVLDIPSPHWRAQIIAWLVGAHALLLGAKTWPSELEIGAYPGVDWDWSHCLRPQLATQDESGAVPMACWLPEENRHRVLEEVRAYFSEDVYLLWLESISRVDYLEQELAQIPNTFECLYMTAA